MFHSYRIVPFSTASASHLRLRDPEELRTESVMLKFVSNIMKLPDRYERYKLSFWERCCYSTASSDQCAGFPPCAPRRGLIDLEYDISKVGLSAVGRSSD